MVRHAMRRIPHEHDILARVAPARQRARPHQRPPLHRVNHAQDPLDPGVVVGVVVAHLGDGHVFDFVDEAGRVGDVVREHEVEVAPGGDGVRDDVALGRHPDFHGEFLEDLAREGILPDLGVRHDGSIGAVGGGGLGLDVWEERSADDGVEAVGADEQVECVLLASFGGHMDLL